LSSSLKTAGVLDPKKIAAAAAVVGVPGDNSNAVSIAAIAKNNAITFTTAASTQTSSISGYFNSFVSKVGIDVQGATNAASQSTAYLRQLNTLWESNSGVSLDEELTNLIKYQKAFQGSAKLINTATEMMDTVLGMVR
jgi:flagellar hook-associated protein 1 FlgK